MPTSADSTYSAFCADWRIRLKDRWTHPMAAAYWPQCLAVEAMSRPQLLALQRERLDGLLRDILQHVPFYRRWAAERGFSADKLPDLADLPVITKADIRAEPDVFQSERFPAREMVLTKTSGSSGEPFRVRMHVQSLDYSYCCFWRAARRHGLRPGHRRAYIWGRSYQFNATARAIAWVRLRQRVRNWLNNGIGIDAYSLTDSNVRQAIGQIEQFRPVYLHGYVSALYTIARQMLDEGRTFADLGLKAAITESEKVYDFQRQAMERAFACPVVEHYGSVELGNLAEQDPAGRLRVNEDQYIIESLPGGQAAVTNLFSHAYPLVRYRLGDLVELAGQPPSDALPYAQLKEVIGRTVDLIPIAGGFVHGVALAHVIDPHLKHVRKYQVHQTALDQFTVKLVPAADAAPPDVVGQIEADLRKMVGAAASVRVEQVAEIAPAPSGKFRWVISDVSQPGTAAPAGPAPASAAERSAP